MADTLCVIPSLTSLSLGENELGDEGATVIARALKESKTSKLALLNLNGLGSSKKIGPAGAKELAEYISVSASLTECNLRGNRLGVEGWTIIFNALRDSPTSNIATWNLAGEELGPRITKPLADYISATASVTSVR